MTHSIIALIIYSGLLIAIGAFRYKARSAEDFMIASRGLGFFSSALTIFASKVGAGLLLTFTALVFSYGYWAMSLFVGFIVGYCVFYFFARHILLVAKRDPDVYTMAGYFESKYLGSGKYIAAIASLTMVGWVLTNFIGGGELLASVSGLSFEGAVVLTAIVVFVYVMFAGFVAVVRTDVVQSIAMLALIGVLIVIISGNVELYELPNTVGGSIPFGKIAIFLITGILFPLGSAELWERVIATRDLPTLKRSLVMASAAYVAIGLLLGMVSLLILAGGQVDDPNQALVVGLQTLVPSEYSWIVVVILASAILSSADTFVFSASALIGQHLVGNRRTALESRKRRIVVTAAVISIAGALSAIMLRNIVDVTLVFASITLGLGAIALTTWILPRIEWSTLMAEIIGLVLSTVVGLVVFGVSEILVVASVLGVALGWAIGVVVRKLQSL